MTRAAFLYHDDGLRQHEVAERLQVSQARVSRLLNNARELGIIRTTIIPPPGIHTALAHQLINRFGLDDVHVVEVPSPVESPDDEDVLTRVLGVAAARMCQDLLEGAERIGLTSWSRAQRAMVAELSTIPDAVATHVVEMLGDIGSPEHQHEAAEATRRLASVVEARPVYLRTPAVSTSPAARELALSENSYAGEAVQLLDDLDLAFIGVGPPEIVPPIEAGRTFFTNDDFEQVATDGAVSELNLRFLDADGAPVHTALDGRVTGITLDQLRSARTVVAVAGGPRKHRAILAALRGDWLDVLVTDVATARWLVDH